MADDDRVANALENLCAMLEERLDANARNHTEVMAAGIAELARAVELLVDAVNGVGGRQVPRS